MKRWMVISIVAVFMLLIIGAVIVMYYLGYLQSVTWQSITIVFAAGSGPAKLLYDKLSTDDDPNDGIDDSILGKFKEKIMTPEAETESKTGNHSHHDHKQDHIHDNEPIREREHRVALLDQELKTLEVKIELLHERKNHLETEVNTLNSNLTKH